MTHPLAGFDIQGMSIKCFDEGGSGFFHFSPISVVIGKNNAGKSTVVDLIDISINRGKGSLVTPSQSRTGHRSALEVITPLTEAVLKRTFSASTSGGLLSGNHWEFGKLFVDAQATWGFGDNGQTEILMIDCGNLSYKGLNSKVQQMFAGCNEWSLANCTLLRVAAERSVGPETSGSPLPKPNGSGITNLIRYFINNDAQPRDVIEIDLLKDLNTIYSGDCEFVSIVCQENDSAGTWEIFLREEGKGDIRLSESGSSLQSVFIVLSYLKLVPLLNAINWGQLILAIEEPENNLHPALLRRLINFLAEKRKELGFSLVITTHSPVCIDWATGREDAGIIHVVRDGACSKCRNVMDYDDRTNILDDLDVRGSDILQSNGIIWVEGPSDRVYLRRWLDLFSEGDLVEGSHYTFMYYGGKILSHFEAVPESDLSTLISMVTLNRNVAVVIDSDRRYKLGSTRQPSMRLNTTKTRLREEVTERGGLSWVTAGKEIENYTPANVWQRLVGEDFKLDHDFVDIPNMAIVKAIKSTKVALAHEVAQVLKIDDLRGHLDLYPKLKELVRHIRRWNSMDI